MRNRRLLIVAVVLAVIFVAGIVVFGVILPGMEPSKTSGTLPAFTSQFGDIKTRAKTSAPTSTTGAYRQGADVSLVSFVSKPREAVASLFQGFEFTSCTELRGST